VTVVFGPSGCGKTTLLRAVAGLERHSQGLMEVENETWLSQEYSMPAEQRRAGFVFQTPSLFSHLTVEQNLLYGRKRLKKSPKITELNEFYKKLGVHSLLHRSSQELSGGEAQRVALGRALLSEPQLLLMDEPLSALDQASRYQLMCFLENLFEQIEIPVFYVTHSTEEVARLADNLVLMNAGQVSDYGPIKQVLGRLDGGLSRSDVAFSVFQGHIDEKQSLPSLTTVRCAGGVALQLPKADQRFQAGQRVRLRIRAKDVSLCLEQPKGSSILNILPAKISDISELSYAGSKLIKLDVGEELLLSKVSEHSVKQLDLKKGQLVYAQIKSVALLN
jgi:molybdate transport system ATP-binding protein